MINRFRSTVNNVIANLHPIPRSPEKTQRAEDLPVKFPYSRPEFLNLSDEEVKVSADHVLRPILVPRDIARLPWYSGYSEVINAGKSLYNEDQAAIGIFHLGESSFDSQNQPAAKSGTSDTPSRENSLDQDDNTYTYFAIYDGHAGNAGAVMAVHTLHLHIQEHLNAVANILINSPHYSLPEGNTVHIHNDKYHGRVKWPFHERDLPTESLICGALENAFWDMDEQIGHEKHIFRIPGGCTALVAIFLHGKLYLSCAGDSRAIIVRNNEIIEMSQEFTPSTERQRLQHLAWIQPCLLDNEFTHLEFHRRIYKKDIGKRVLYRDKHMTGWAHKIVTAEDTKFPLIYGDGKKSRMLATIGVTRGFGDHELKVHDTNIYLKPFLSPIPETRIYDLNQTEHSENDVLIMASDGLWDILSNQEAADIVKDILENFPPGDMSRYASAAQELVMQARGILKQNGWRTMGDTRQASNDDITVFVIPLHCHVNLSSQSSLTESQDALST
ncbi:protein phosphatase 1H-like [Saccoglossus kowalevskii]|uniref:Protein phosphatase 1H-like n=1 Tax=Saccoglossus kowalevskii TaxID=10224 RepID=A0ABM0GWJ2_SACKO|nr:PREDICTED: protein phosphatase 1H-like [Saccoglossus kowalevskii]